MEAEDNGAGEEVGLLVLEAKSLRPFKTKDEYLYAMKEDLAEWFKCLYEDIIITAENFLEVLETGVLLCQHANEVRKFTAEQKEKGTFQMKSNFVRDIQIPQYEVQFRVDVKPETFLARDNVSNFITWTVKMGIPEVLRFETDDLVLRKNERSVVLCLLEVARVGAKFGMLAPTIVQMEEEIDEEIATGEPPPQIKTCDIKSLDEMVRELVGRCTCPVQFPIIKVGEGKYKIGDSQTLVFVRILRKHVMIRVGGGWDTLEHYLDRHDPCRCNFQGHRQGGRGPTTPRRSSVSAASQSLPNTPRTQRKLSIASPATNQAQTNQAHPNIRSASPGPNFKKLPLNRTNSQPDTSIPSPGTSVKSPNFSSSGTNFGIPRNSSASNVSVSKSRTLSQSSNVSSSVKSGSVSGPTNQRRSASPAPGVRRSQSPAPEVINRLRSPSPAPSSSKTIPGTRTQSVPASVAKRCASPVKQITMSELRSSREGKSGLQVLRRQTSVESSGNADSDVMERPSENKSDTNIAIDKISTMSLGEFKNLLNSALSVPNGAGSQCSSDSPRSQSSVDSFRNNQIPPNKKGPPNKSASNYRPGVSNKNISSMSKTNSLPRTKSSSLDGSSSGYSTSSVSSDKPKKTTSTASPSSTYARTAGVRPKTPSGDIPTTGSRTVTSRSTLSSKQTAVSSVGQSTSVTNQSKPKSSSYKTLSQTSLNSEGSSVKPNNTSTVPSRSSSQSSFKSYDSYSELDSYVSNGLRRVETDGSLHMNNTELDNVTSGNNANSQNSSGYLRSNSYTPCASAADKAKWAAPRTELRATSEPKEVVKSDSVVDKQPLNVGYASFSHSERNGFNDSYKFDEELSKIENELKKYENSNDDISVENELSINNTAVEKPSETDFQKPVCRPSTPSLIPRPSTPKMSRKLSVPRSDENDSLDKPNENRGRPPTPKKSNIIARAPAATTSVRAADASKEKTYKDIFYSKRSTTPGPGNVSSTPAKDTGRRCTTPGPMSRTSSLSSTSATTTRARLNQTLDQNKDTPLSVFDEKNNENQNNRSRNISRSSNGGSNVRAQSFDSRSLQRQNATEQPETVIMVNRSDTGHSLTVQNQAQPKTNTSRPSVLARARTEDSRSRTQTRSGAGISRQRPQSVEPRQLLPRSRNNSESNEKNVALSVRRGENGQHEVYDRTQEWVQTAAEQTSKVQKTKVMKQANPKVRRAMTPNSFHKRIDQEEPRSFEEIKAALTLPINGLTRIEVDAENLDAPPEDPEMYATMEKLFNELRQQELKASVNETPGSNANPSKSSKSKSKSSSSMNDEEASLDSNKNIKQKKFTLSASCSAVTSPNVPQKKPSVSSNNSQTPAARQPSRTSSTSSVSATPSTPRSTVPSTPRSTPPRTTPPRTTEPPRPASPSMNRSSQPQRPSSPSMNRSAQPPRPSSPSMNRSAQPPRPSSPRTTVTSQQSRTPVQRPASPRTTSNPPRPASPKSFQSPIPVSPRTTQPSVPASPRNGPSSKPVTPRSAQPPRPASTPPRPSSPVERKSTSRASDDSDGVFEKEKVGASSIMSKIKEIIKVKPRKDKADGVKQKSRIPAPKSLASAGKSRSFSNLSSVKSMTLPNTKANGHLDYELDRGELNGMPFENEINGGLNVTFSGRSEAPKLKMTMPLTTGRATVIRKESIEKNKNPPRLLRAVSVERNMGGLKNNFQYYEEGEYV